MGHESVMLMTSLGLCLRRPQKNESLNELIKEHFSKKTSVLECQECRNLNREHGMDWMEIVKYPKYLIVFLAPFDEKGELPRQLRQFSQEVDLLQFTDDSHDKADVCNSISYDLTAILSHKGTTNEDSMYTAAVKKKVNGEKEKQWMSFNKLEQKRITKVDARIKFPA